MKSILESGNLGLWITVLSVIACATWLAWKFSNALEDPITQVARREKARRKNLLGRLRNAMRKEARKHDMVVVFDPKRNEVDKTLVVMLPSWAEQLTITFNQHNLLCVDEGRAGIGFFGIREDEYQRAVGHVADLVREASLSH